jgi:hypothetical protein
MVNNNEHITKIDEIIDNHTFMISTPITTPITDNSMNYVFVYGQEVNDFLSLEKNAIFTIKIGAIKELYKELEETKKTVDVLNEQMEYVMSIIKH